MAGGELSAQSPSAQAIPLAPDASPTVKARLVKPKYLGDLNDDLTFTPVTPCRLADTRFAPAGPLPPRAARAFSATSNSAIASAGGNPAGCGIPAGPTALALTITAVLPPQVGNIVAYADGTPVPLSSALNFLAGQIIANTTVVPSTSAVGNNFDLFNNRDGATQVVVDVVGYYYAPQAPDCAPTINTTNAANGAGFNVASTCPSGYRISMGGCLTTGFGGGTNWIASTYNATLDGWVCAGVNNSGQSATITSESFCCRRPGR